MFFSSWFELPKPSEQSKCDRNTRTTRSECAITEQKKKNKMSKGSQKFSPPNERTANIPLYAETDEKSANKMDEEPN